MTHTKRRKLIPEAEALLNVSKGERIRFIQKDRWIGYSKAQEALEELERLFGYEDSRRPENLLIVADTNNGKTTIVDQFKERHPDVDDPLGDGVLMPVVKLDAPQSADEDRFYNHILESLGAVYKMRAPKDAKFFQICKLLRDLGTRVLIFDEINNSLSGNRTQRGQLFNAIKEFGNHLKRPVVLTGTFDALIALREDKQIQNRFPPLALPRWQLDEDFLRLLGSFETTLPLKRASGLKSEALAPLLYVMSGGVIGELHRVLVRAAEAAIKEEKKEEDKEGNKKAPERITRKLLLNLKWIPPADRDRNASAAEHGLEFNLSYRDRLRELGHGELTQDDDDSED